MSIRFLFCQSHIRTHEPCTVPSIDDFMLCFSNIGKKKSEFSRIFNAIKFTWTRMLRFSFRLIPFGCDIESPRWKSRTVGTKQLFYRFARHPNWIASLPDTFKYALWFYNVPLQCILHARAHTRTQTSNERQTRSTTNKQAKNCSNHNLNVRQNRNEFVIEKSVSLFVQLTNKHT